jgi:hypothetical protein
MFPYLCLNSEHRVRGANVTKHKWSLLDVSATNLGDINAIFEAAHESGVYKGDNLIKMKRRA